MIAAAGYERPTWAPVDDDTADLLSVLADPNPTIGADVPEAFLAACRRDAMANDGLVSVNRVRPLMTEQNIEHHQYSAMWSRFTGRGRPMVKTTEWEICQGSTSGNNGRPYPVRRWVG